MAWKDPYEKILANKQVHYNYEREYAERTQKSIELFARYFQSLWD
jgi:hypothetical protein